MDVQISKAIGGLGKQAKGRDWKCAQPARKCKSICFCVVQKRISKMLLEAASFLAWG